MGLGWMILLSLELNQSMKRLSINFNEVTLRAAAWNDSMNAFLNLHI